MDRKDRDFIREALQEQRPHERYNKALARVVSEQMRSRSGYKKYINLMEKLRTFAKDNNCSIEEAAKKVTVG